MNRHVAAAVAATVLTAVTAAGCAAVKSSTKPGYEPVHLETPSSTTEPKIVKFTEEAARRVGVATEVVRAADGRLVVPSMSLIFEKSGQVLVFQSTDPLTYHRVPVVLVKDDGTKAQLSSGPAVGSRVVTVGANQVWGAEQGVGH